MPADLEKAIPYHCIHNAPIFALIGNRIHPQRLPQGSMLPAAIFELISTAPVQTHRERSILPRQRFQFTYYGGTYDTCKQVGDAFKSLFDGYRGQIGTGAYITTIDAFLFKDERTDDDLDTGIFWRQHDYLVIWK